MKSAVATDCKFDDASFVGTTIDGSAFGAVCPASEFTPGTAALGHFEAIPIAADGSVQLSFDGAPLGYYDLVLDFEAIEANLDLLVVGAGTFASGLWHGC